jgi:hypothetical protein
MSGYVRGEIERYAQSDRPRSERAACYKALFRFVRILDNYAPETCLKCGTSHTLRNCPWCGHLRAEIIVQEAIYPKKRSRRGVVQSPDKQAEER